MNYEHLVVEIDSGIALITINRPKVLNTLNAAVLEELDGVFKALHDNENLACIILTGAGEKAFVAGADISAMQTMTVKEAVSFCRQGQKILNTIEGFPRPVIAAVNGFALGGGCELAMACDVRLASENARFGQPEVNLGVIPGFGGTQRLPRLVGRGRAKELLFTGDMIDAAEACRIGLVNKVVPQDLLLEEARKMAAKIATKGPLAVSMAKQAVDNGLEMDLDRAASYEAGLFGLCFASPEQKEGMLAFLEKRPARFRG